MVYNTQNGPKRGLQNPQTRLVMVLAGVGLGAFALGGLVLAPMIRAGSKPHTVVQTAQPAPRVQTAPLAPKPSLTVEQPSSTSPARPAEDELQITEVKPSETATPKVEKPASRPAPRPEPERVTPPAPPEEKVAAEDRPEPPAEKAVRAPIRRPRQTARRSSERSTPPDEVYFAGRRVDDPSDEEDTREDSPRREDSDDEASPRSLLGVWSGAHTGHPATLVVDRVRGRRFSGSLRVRTGGREIVTRVNGRVDRDGQVTWDESEARGGNADAWDPGSNAGALRGSGRMAGSGRDTRGRSYNWSFSR